MKICFWGYCLDINKHSYQAKLSGADNNMQLGYIYSIESSIQDGIHIISEYEMTNSSKKNIIESMGMHSEIEYISTRYNRILKKLIKIWRPFIAVFKWCWTNRKEEKVIFVYNAFVKYFFILFLIRPFLKIRIIPIVITFPYLIENTGFKKEIYNIEHSYMKYALRKCDGIVGITPFIIEDLQIKVPFRIVNGGIDVTRYKRIQSKVLLHGENVINITYSGALYIRYNLKNIIEAIDMLPEYTCIFNIFGNGEEADYFKNLHKENVRYYGFLEQEKIMGVLKESDILVALLEMGDQLERYTFPSKILEYLASGTEVVCTNVISISSDLKRHMHIIDNVDPKTIAEEIRSILQFSKRRNTIETERLLKKNYSWKYIGDQMVSLIDEMEKGRNNHV